jgi:hypothetical protein
VSQDIPYAQMLRPIGQVIESRGMESFSVTVEGDDVVVRGSQPPRPQEAISGPSLKSLWRLLRGAQQPEHEPETSARAELRYTREDIARLDAEGRNRRRGAPSAPEPHSASQILRAAGRFVDQKEGRLLAVAKEGPKISLVYESAGKTNVSEQFTVSELYDFWVKMYLKRGERSAPK